MFVNVRKKMHTEILIVPICSRLEKLVNDAKTPLFFIDSIWVLTPAVLTATVVSDPMF